LTVILSVAGRPWFGSLRASRATKTSASRSLNQAGPFTKPAKYRPVACGDSGRMIRAIMPVAIVDSPQIRKILHILCQWCHAGNRPATYHCQLFNPPLPPRRIAPAASNDPNDADVAAPKKKMTARLAISSWVYHRERVYSDPGRKPDSARPRKNLAAYQPLLFLTNIWRTSIRPHTMT